MKNRKEEMSKGILSWKTYSYLYDPPLHGEKGKRLGNGSISRDGMPDREFISSVAQ